MFLLPLTDDEINKIKEKTKNKQETPQDVEEIIKRKWDLKKFYINIPKKSGFGFWINYAPGCKEW